MAVFSLCGTSCSRTKRNQDANGTDSNHTSANHSVKAAKATPALSKSTLEKVGRLGALVQIPDQSGQGILLEGAGGGASGRNYLVICEAQADLTTVGVVCQAGSKIEKVFAKRISLLPSGLSIFGFSSNAVLTCGRMADPVAGETYHAIRLRGEGSIPDEEVAAITAELETVRNQVNDSQAKSRSEAMRQMSDRSHNGRDPRERGEAMPQEPGRPGTDMRTLIIRQSALNARLKLQMKSITAVEVAAGDDKETLSISGAELDNTLLATSSGRLRAIRFKGQWVDLQEILTTSGDQVETAKIELTGSKESVNLSCALLPLLPSAENSYSMIAATTFELESQGSGSLEERLAKVAPVPFQGRGKDIWASRQLEWNGRKTKLWLKVFNDKDPAKLLLDEVILLDYPETFSARWGKPPSPLIALPAPQPDTPGNLVKEQKALDAKGEIRDIIAAGDGSVVMVQTNQAPYWTPLDLKTGQWMSVPWRASEDTLVATQAGKIYLVDRKTKVVQIWGLLSGKREGMQLLPLPGTITAVAAPLSDGAQPLMVCTEHNGYLLDPVRFEVIPSGLDLGYVFDAELSKRRGQMQLDATSLGLRASDDGSLYELSGTSVGGSRTSRSNLMFTVDRSSMVVSKSNGDRFLASRGRNTSREFPDHGGSATSIMVSHSGGRFPGSAGEIRFMDAKDREALAVMKNPPVLPTVHGQSDGYLVADRGVYLDLSAGTMLLPDGDSLNFVRLNLPPQEKAAPEFLFAGETWEIPLPPGTGHKISAADGGKTEVGPSTIRWSPRVSERENEVALKLEWTGELGSQISKDYRVHVIQPTRSPEVLSPDGSKTIPLHLRGILSEVDSGIVGFAGSGNVVLVRNSDSLSAWNLSTCELILRLKQYSKSILGDADRIYVLGNEGGLTSYDISTGEIVGRADLGGNIQSIATGISSRGSLLAVEQQGTDCTLIQIQRDSLKSIICELPQETRQRLFIPQLVANASGSAAWSRGVAIFRDQRAITVTGFPYEIANGVNGGVPDASGQLFVGDDVILNTTPTPPKSVKISSISGMGDMTRCKLDQSGRYLLLAGPRDDGKDSSISLRDVREPSKELLEIHCPSTSGGELPWILSGTNTLIQFKRMGGDTRAVIYDFNVSDLIQQLSH